MPGNWLEELKVFLCRIYREWGGDCAGLPISVPAQITVLENEYQQDGPPTFPDQAAADAFLQLLTDTENHLASSDDSLTQEDRRRLTTLIDALQEDLGGSGT
jgi:hypothetical protein